jgi:hypothetical protein
LDNKYLDVNLMPNVSIIRSETPKGPADIISLRRGEQRKRRDPEARLLRGYRNEYPTQGSQELKDKITEKYCKKLGISFEQFLHKLEIFSGMVEDDECEWREQKYGKQEQKKTS